MKAPRIFLIYATALAIDPTEAEIVNLLEDSLSHDRVEAEELIIKMMACFLMLSHYAVQSAADAIVFSCSVFGDAIDLCKADLTIPALKPNDAMIRLALTQASRVAVLTTFEPALDSIMAEFRQMAERSGRALEVMPYFIPVAMQALSEGDKGGRNTAISEIADQLGACELNYFSQFSITNAVEQTQAHAGLSVLTTPVSAVLEFRRMLQADDLISSQDGCLPNA